MNIADVAIIILAVTAGVRGIELGLVRQAFSATGFLTGLFLGAWLQGFIMHSVSSPGSKAFLSVLVLASCSIICMTAGEILGMMLKRKVQESKVQAIEKADRTGGAVVGCVAVVAAVWLLAAVFSHAPLPWVQQQVQGSVIVSRLGQAMPEAPALLSRLGHLIAPNGFPDVFEGLEPRIDIGKPLPSMGQMDPAIQKTRTSIVKVSGKGCGGTSTGSGFVAAPGMVVTNAHVIAGVTRPIIVDAAGQHTANVAWFDPRLDVAVLRVKGLAGAPLTATTAIARAGTSAAVLGYPEGGDFNAEPATILDSFVAVGRDLYNQETIQRQVYSVKAAVLPGNSGGPVIDQGGTVIGLVFAKSTAYDRVGYALTMQQVTNALSQAQASNNAVSTGSCR